MRECILTIGVVCKKTNLASCILCHVYISDGAP